MKEGKPFPHIPLIDAEERTPEEQGAPKSTEDSLLLAHADELNLVGTDIGLSRGKPQAERRRVQRERFETFLGNPEAMERYFDTLHIIEARGAPEEQSKETDLQKYERTFFLDVGRYIEIPKEYDPAVLREWFSLSLKSDLYRPVAERVLKTWYSGKTPESVMKFLYSFTQGIIESADEQVFIEGVKTLCGEGKIFFNDERSFFNFLTSIFKDDRLLSQEQQVDGVASYYAPRYAPESYARWRVQIDKTLNSAESIKLIDAYRNRDPKKMEKMWEYMRWMEKSNVVPRNKLHEWPYKLLFDPDPLRVALHKRIEIEEGKVSFVLPHGGAAIHDPFAGRLRSTVIDDLESGKNLPQEQRTFSDQNVVSSIFYLMPDEAVTHRYDILKENIRLREEILQDQHHSLSPRGDKIITVDQTLKDLGFENLTFRLAEEKPRMTVEVRVRNHTFLLEMNRDLNIEEAGTHEQFQVALDRRMFFEYILLSHLRELLCGERILPGQRDALSNAETLEREKEFKGRRGHRRDLPTGQKPNIEQIRRALEEQGWDMVRINEENTARGARLQTYVKISQVSTGADPVISRAPHAMDGFKKIAEDKTPEVPPSEKET